MTIAESDLVSLKSHDALFTLENGHIRVVVNAQGELVSAFNKKVWYRTSVLILCSSSCCVLAGRSGFIKWSQ